MVGRAPHAPRPRAASCATSSGGCAPTCGDDEVRLHDRSSRRQYICIKWLFAHACVDACVD
eukprot:2886420-Prymnesium_polylepis.1